MSPGIASDMFVGLIGDEACEADESQQRRQQHVSSIKGSRRTFAAIGWTGSRPARMSPGMASGKKFLGMETRNMSISSATKSHRVRWQKSADVGGDEAYEVDESQQRRQQHV
ncbi:hypothetical protein K0M31_004345 [Melipona bicolor]|uniref:Uncharacterized protein n=1 Tax=Melipona bicolor TaxID=60889 RepID=A0AA40FX39_9HYME|nr:hypothetical protein K0M31_004345 [Melipona bicolor]